jgi:uncharacterized membrane protein
MPRFIIIFVILVGVASWAQDYTYTTISDPKGTSGTQAARISNTGDVTGDYSTPTAVLGFSDVNNIFTTIAPPGAGTAEALKVNSSGEIVGFYRKCSTNCNATIPDIAFLYSKGKYTSVMSPSKTLPSIQFNGINDAGVIVGSLSLNPSTTCASETSVCRGGFIYQGGNKFDYLVAFGSPDTIACDISNSGEIIGIYLTPTKHVGSFSYVKGKYTPISVPGAQSTYVFGIAPTTGEIVGVYINSSGDKVAFVDRGGVFTTINVPGSKAFSTRAYGINDNGDIVGSYKRSGQTIREGFLAKP